MSRTWRSWAVLGAAAVVLAACASDDGPPRSADPDTTVQTRDGVALLVETEEFDGAVAGVEMVGELGVVRGRCVGTVYASRPRLLVFPPGTTLSGSGDDIVVTVEGVELRPGDAFDAGARNSSPRALTAFGDLADQVPRACRGIRAWVLDDVEPTERPANVGSGRSAL